MIAGLASKIAAAPMRLFRRHGDHGWPGQAGPWRSL